MSCIVQFFAADGNYSAPRERKVSTLAKARAIARLGLSRLTKARAGNVPDDDGLVAIECWNDMTRSEAARTCIACGDIAIYRGV